MEVIQQQAGKRATKCHTAHEIRIMSADTTTVIASPGVEPTYSAQEAAAMLGRSYSVLEQFPLAIRAYQRADRLANGGNAEAIIGVAESLVAQDHDSLRIRAPGVNEGVRACIGECDERTIRRIAKRPAWPER